MLDRHIIKRLSETDLEEYTESFSEQLELSKRRVERLREKKERDPGFYNHDPLIDCDVSIDIYIEEWEAVRDELKEQLKIIGDERNRRRGLNQTIRMF